MSSTMRSSFKVSSIRTDFLHHIHINLVSISWELAQIAESPAEQLRLGEHYPFTSR
jgi:hypothetical protein